MALYGLTAFVSAFLLFEIEPMLAKYILPWFGGAQAVWATALLFFQSMLLLGYAWAHWLASKVAPRRQAVTQATLAGVTVVTIAVLAARWASPVMPSMGWWGAGLAERPVSGILLVLAAGVGLPYFTLAATAPLLQAWWARLFPARSPYRLYALSNLGSLLALLCYPFAVEPELRLSTQGKLWAALFVLFALMMGACATRLWQGGDKLAHEPAPATKPVRPPAVSPARAPTLDRWILWGGLTACAALMLYASTSEITQDIAPVPLLWVWPLALYLLSFVICFDNERWYRRGLFQPLLGLALVANLFIETHHPAIERWSRPLFGPELAGLAVPIAAVSLLLFTVCMVCHGELVRIKPGERYLTGFYLVVSAGGVLGGVFAVLIAPQVFPGYWEYRLASFLCPALLLLAVVDDRDSWIHQPHDGLALALTALALALPLIVPGPIAASPGFWFLGIFALGVVAGLVYLRRAGHKLIPAAATGFALALAVAVLGTVYVALTWVEAGAAVLAERNFYGVFRVVANDKPTSTGSIRSYELWSGRIVHGEQFPAWRNVPTTYYGPDSGVGVLFKNYPRSAQGGLKVAVIGLGVGTLAAWGLRGDSFRFYELNPAVVALATDLAGYFTFVRDSEAKVTIVTGDGRLALRRELPQRAGSFDVLVVDAFNGDAIPTHLLTVEAMRIYLRALAPQGVLAVHISNRYLRLLPVLAGLKRYFHLYGGEIQSHPANAFFSDSDWVLLARDDRVLGQAAFTERMASLDGLRDPPLWTDDYSNLFQLLR